MLDLKRIRREPEAVREALQRRGFDASVVERLLELDERRREAVAAFETLRAEQNRVSEAIGRAKKSGEDASAAIAEMQQVAAQVKQRAAERDAASGELEQLMLTLPNLADPDAPLEDTVLREVGEAGKTGRDQL